MKKFLGVALGALLVSTASANDLTIWFSPQDIGVNPVVGTGTSNDVGQVLPDPGTPINPVVDGSSTVRLHIWGTAPRTPASTWNGIALDIQIDGPATIVGGGGLNVVSVDDPTLYRWELGSDLDLPSLNFVSITGRGLKSPPDTLTGWTDRGGATADDDSTYLGYVDFLANGGTSSVYFAVGQAGITRQGGTTADNVFFGAGDAALHGNQFGQRSAVADATITPEPASLLLLGLAGLALRRR
jgi:hypothetical protein